MANKLYCIFGHTPARALQIDIDILGEAAVDALEDANARSKMLPSTQTTSNRT